jgi:hypothetical protein
MLELRSVPAVSRGPEGDAQEGMASAGAGQGLLVSVLWQVKDNTVIGEAAPVLEACTALEGPGVGAARD